MNTILICHTAKVRSIDNTAPAPTPANIQLPQKRGRPAAAPADEEPPKKRGRPAKAAPTKATSAPTTTGKKRGRPAKAKTNADAVGPEDEQATPRKRHSGRTGGETTKIESDDEDAAEQLEEELLDAADEAVEAEEPTRKRKPAPKKGQSAKGKAKKSIPNEEVSGAAQQSDAAISNKQYWLMKAEQDGHEATLKNGELFNTKFTIDDLLVKDVPEP